MKFWIQSQELGEEREPDDTGLESQLHRRLYTTTRSQVQSLPGLQLLQSQSGQLSETLMKVN